MKNSLRKSLLTLLLTAGIVGQAQAVAPVFEKTDTLSGDSFQSVSYAFSIPSVGEYTAVLTDNVLPAMFDFLKMSITKTGGATMGSVELGTSNTGSFSFLASTTGSYTALVFGDPGTITLPKRGGGSIVVSAGTFGVTVSPVPEAETYMMLISGLALVGVVARRRLAAKRA